MAITGGAAIPYEYIRPVLNVYAIVLYHHGDCIDRPGDYQQNEQKIMLYFFFFSFSKINILCHVFSTWNKKSRDTIRSNELILLL